MTKENNKMQVDIDTLKKQNVNDLLSIKELYSKLEEVREKITQINYIDNTLVKKIKKEYEKLEKIVLDENIQFKLTNDIETINSHLDTKANKDDIKTINSQLEHIAFQVTKENISKLQQIINNSKTNLVINFPYNTSFKLNDNIVLKSNTVINGNNCTFMNKGFVTVNNDYVYINSCNFVGDETEVDYVGINISNTSNVIVRDCNFKNSRAAFYGKNSSMVEIARCVFDGNYINKPNNDPSNTLTIIDCSDIIINNNKFLSKNVYRHIKFASSSYVKVPERSYSIINDNGKDLRIINNTFKGSMRSTIKKQIIDLYSGFDDVIFTNNHVEVDGFIETVIEGKMYGESPEKTITNKFNNVLISNNIIRGSFLKVFAFGNTYGSDAIDNEGNEYTNNHSVININNNNIIAETYRNCISVDGFNHVKINNNTLLSKEITSDTRGILLYRNENVDIIGNTVVAPLFYSYNTCYFNPALDDLHFNETNVKTINISKNNFINLNTTSSGLTLMLNDTTNINGNITIDNNSFNNCTVGTFFNLSNCYGNYLTLLGNKFENCNGKLINDFSKSKIFNVQDDLINSTFKKSYYISSTGNDNNYGDTNNPLLTVEEVLNRIKFIKCGTVEIIFNDNYTGNIIIEGIKNNINFTLKGKSKGIQVNGYISVKNNNTSNLLLANFSVLNTIKNSDTNNQDTNILISNTKNVNVKYCDCNSKDNCVGINSALGSTVIVENCTFEGKKYCFYAYKLGQICLNSNSGGITITNTNKYRAEQGGQIFVGYGNTITATNVSSTSNGGNIVNPS